MRVSGVLLDGPRKKGLLVVYRERSFRFVLFALATAHSRPQARQGPSHVFKCCVAPGGDSLEQARKITIKPLRETNVSVAQA